MRISFSIPLKPLSGKHKFAIRLAAAMEKQGVKVTHKKPHVNLVFLKGTKPKCKNIFRLDGIWMNTRMSYQKRNKKLKNLIRACDGLIYQNKFCKKASDNFLGKFKNHAVISNGAPLDLNPAGAYQHPKPYILTFCRWRPHKRLKQTVKGFLNSGLAENYDLFVLGEPDYIKKHPSIIYKGKVTKGLSSIIKGCDYVMHLAYIDWCPNSVVEALVCGKNVLHTNTGGTKYVVKDNGIKVQDKKWDYSAIDLYSPPPLDQEEITEGMHKMIDLPLPQVDYLDINNVAKAYIEYCRKVLN